MFCIATTWPSQTGETCAQLRVVVTHPTEAFCSAAFLCTNFVESDVNAQEVDFCNSLPGQRYRPRFGLVTGNLQTRIKLVLREERKKQECRAGGNARSSQRDGAAHLNVCTRSRTHTTSHVRMFELSTCESAAFSVLQPICNSQHPPSLHPSLPPSPAPSLAHCSDLCLLSLLSVSRSRFPLCIVLACSYCIC